MSRKTATWTAVDGRDKGKRFVLSEPPAAKSEAVAFRTFLAAARSGVSIPDNVRELGLVGLAIYGIELLGKLPYEDAQYVADFLMAGVKIDEGKLQRDLDPDGDDIEEVATLLKLKREMLQLITGFTLDVGALTSGRRPTESATAASSTT